MPEIANLVVKYSADTKDAEAGADRVNSSIGKVAKVGAALAVAGGALLGGFFAKSIGAAANFEQGMDGVAASLGGVGVAGGITADQFTKLQDEALRIGQTTSVGATDAARAMDLLAKSGIPVEEIYGGVAQGVVDVSTATGESLDQSAATYGALQNLFRDTGISSEQLSDTVVNAMNASNMSLSEFQTGISRMGPIIAATGMPLGDAAGALAYFNSQGFSAAEVGTSLTAAFNNLVAPTNEMAIAQQAAGISAFDAQGKFVGWPAIMDQVQAATEGMTDAQRAQTIASLFGADAADLMTLASKKGGEQLRKTTKDMNKSGTAATAAATRMDNLKGDVENLKGAFETLSIRVGTAFLPMLRGVVQGLTGGVVAVTGFAQSVIKLMDNGLNPAEAMFRVLGNRLIALGGGQGILAEIGRGFQRLGDLAHGLGEALADVMDAFQDLRRGDFAGAWREIQEAAQTAWDAISQFAGVTLDWVLDTGIPTVIGWVVDYAGDVWNGIKSAAGWAWDGIADLGGWSLNVGVPSVVGAITGIAGRLGDWLRSYIYGGGLVGDGTGGPEPGPGGGIVVDIAQITLNVLDAIANIQASDVQGWIQERLDEIGTVQAEINEWSVILGADPEVEGDPKGRSEKSISDILGAAILNVPILGWAIMSTEDPDLLFDPLKMANDALQKVFEGAQIKLDDIAWALQLLNPTLLFPAGWNLVQSIKDKLPPITIPAVKWLISLAVPDINIPGKDQIMAAIRVAGEAAGIPGWILDRVLGGGSGGDFAQGVTGGPGNAGSPKSGRNIGTEGSGYPTVGGEQITTLPNVGSGSTAILNQVKAMGQQVAAAMTQLAASVRSGVQQAMAALNPMGTAFTATGARINAAMTQMRAQVTTNVTAMVAAIRAQFTAMQAGATATMTAMTAATNAQVTAMAAQVRAQFTAMAAAAAASANQMRSTVQSAMQGMAGAGASAMNQFASAVRSGFQQAAAAAQSGVAAIRGAVNSIGSLYGQGFSIGSSFGQGVAAGLYSMLGAVQAAAAAIVAAAAQAAAAKGQIASPSKLMRDEIGIPLAQGVIVGMESQRSNVASAFAGMIPVDATLGRGYRGGGSGPYAARSSAPAPAVQNVTIYTLKADEYQRLLKQAQNGDRAYQQQQPRARETQLGSSR